MSVFGRKRKRRVIPNNVETEPFPKKKSKREVKSLTPIPVSTSREVSEQSTPPTTVSI